MTPLIVICLLNPLAQEASSRIDKTKAVKLIQSVAAVIERREQGLADYSGVFNSARARVNVRSKGKLVSIQLSRGFALFDNASSKDLRAITFQRDLDLASKRDARRGLGISEKEARNAFAEYWSVLNPTVKARLFLVRRLGEDWEVQGFHDADGATVASGRGFVMRLDADQGQLVSFY